MLLCCCVSLAMAVTMTIGVLCTFAALVSKAYALGGDSNSKKVLLKNVKSLTLRKDKVTSHRRVSAIPQLNCVGGAGCRHHQIEVMRCENAGADYDDDSIQWTCKATIPDDFKLGSTDVRCEGYKNAQDPSILKGSCGVEYSLLLTEKGMAKYDSSHSSFSLGGHDTGSTLFSWAFWLAFLGVILLMIRAAWRNMRDNNRRTGAPHASGRRPPRPPFDGDGGGGGPWSGGDGDEPPPPYTPFAKPASSRGTGAGPQQPWRPGFWSGAAAGAAATYLGSRGSRATPSRNDIGGQGSSRSNRQSTRSWSGNGEGPSSSSTNWHSSTGFGGTSNR